jgi:hypothetical protein
MSSFRTSSEFSRKEGVVDPRNDDMPPRNGVVARSNDFTA